MMHLPHQKFWVLSTLSLSLLTLTYYPLEALSQTSGNNNEFRISSTSESQEIEYVSTDRDGKPGNTEASSNMGEPCGGVQPSQFKAFVPTANGGILGLTTESHPSFWFYIPYQAEDFHSMKLVVWDDTYDYREEKEIPASQSVSGFMQISLPQTSKPLEVGKIYNVGLTVYCEDPATASDPTDVNKVSVKVAVGREPITPELQSELEQAGDDLRQQAVVYAKHSMWFDALRIIGELRQKNPENPQYQRDWNKLLEDIDMKISE